MASEHPFQVLFETLGRVPVSHAEAVNRQAFKILSDIVAVPVEKAGRCILLRAPRAGHGKTHLLSRLQHQLAASHEFIPLQAAMGCRIDAASVTDDTLRRLVRQLPASGGLTALDLVSRRLFASALQPLVASGEVPCQDREGALTALRSRPIETFDFHHPNAVTAHWARENFEVLGQRLSLELAHRVNQPVGAVSFWVDVLFHFASAPLESSNRIRNLAEAVHAHGGMGGERLDALLGLLTLLMRVVLVADDLEGFSTDETAALRLAAFLGSLRQSVERLDVILSLNRDIWESAFLPRLSDGLADRLSEVVVELEPLTEAEMEALLDSRVPGYGRRVLDRIDIAAAGTHSRGLVRAAGIAWIKASTVDTSGVVSATVPPPVVFAATASPAWVSEPVAEVVLPAAEPVVVESVVPGPVELETAREATPVSEASPFSVAAATEGVQPGTEWPTPVFVPQAVAETIPESAPWQAQVESPFHAAAAMETENDAMVPGDREAPPTFVPPEPVQAFENSWNFPPPSPEVRPEPPIFEQLVDSPFQVVAEPVIAAQAPPSSVSVGTVDSLSPPSQVPFEEFIVPVQEALQVNSPFQNAPQQFVPESGQPPFGDWQQSAPPPPQGIFVAAPNDPISQEPPFWSQNPPASPPVGNFLNEPASPFQDNPEPSPNPPQNTAGATPPPSTADTDRVDELLRQFRERYGRGGL